ncbi:PHP domain-containing protein [Thermohalobacter berrensis]|uniref:Polymerase/histidinol phosphatase N-terminal domain-containing protein n=1 Tax=Thermohalobacter berrensis TaxID=99594 RepID=A0A419SZ27_9FIRM|nr:PHP domain-containing protein [Thermohalobacter berrensis]RKD30522.1 hypothetical protein BET03_04070 [Thermohalobacter berrensis]
MNLIGDFHIHTIASGDAFGTIREIVNVAKKKKLKCISITEHGPKMEASAHYYYFESLIDNVKEDSGLIIYSGVEANIIDDKGTLDLPDSILEKLEFIIVSFHDFSWEDKGIIKNTKALKSALLKYNVKCIAHLNHPLYPIHIQEIIPILIDRNITIEINNKSLKKEKNNWLNFKDIILKCRNKGVKFLVNSDAHYPLQVGEFRTALEFANYAGLKEDDIINTHFDRLIEYFNLRKNC